LRKRPGLDWLSCLRSEAIRKLIDDGRVESHIFICLLAYYVAWHLKQAWAPLLFADEHFDEHTEPNAAAKVSQKKAARQTESGHPVQSFHTLLAHLGTLCRTTFELGESASAIEYTRLTEPTPLQSEAFRLAQQYCSQHVQF